MGARLAFAVAAGPAIARFCVAHQITGSAAWAAALVLMALDSAQSEPVGSLSVPAICLVTAYRASTVVRCRVREVAVPEALGDGMRGVDQLLGRG